MSEVGYWSNFYSNHSSLVPGNASSFAQFVHSWLDDHQITTNGKTLVDLGCGTGRDTQFFAAMGKMYVVGIDQALSTIEINNQKRGNLELYLVGNFVHAHYKECQNVDFLYSRFSIHSISKTDASQLYHWAFSNGLKHGGLFFIEARSINDPLFKLGTPDPAGDPDASICGHYRRFIRLNELVSELETIGFSILYQHESDGLSILGNDNPTLIRIICRS
jgi:SAM-dependent methyltransferase